MVRRSFEFGRLLRHWRDATGLTQEELARRAGLSVPTVSNLERGKSRAPYRHTVRRLADALGLSEKDRDGLLASVSGAVSPGPEADPMVEPLVESAAGNGGALTRIGRPMVEGSFLGARPPKRLVGREEELGRVLGALGAARGGAAGEAQSGAGRGRLVLLAGEAGVGKTRLAQEASVRARDEGFLVATGRCYEAQGGVPFSPFLEMLSGLYERAPQELRQAVPDRWPYLERLLPDHFPSRVATPSESQTELQGFLWAVTGFVRAVAAITPVALFLDDLHWADDASLDLLAHLARHTPGDSVLVVGAYRDTEVGRGHPLRKAARDLDREGLVERVHVWRLGREETAALMADRLDGTEVSEEFARLVHRRTEGNPFFTVEVLRTLIERGQIFAWEGRWVRRELDRIEIPESVREAIAERASRLGPQTWETLKEASVLGQAFGFEDLRAVSGRDEEGTERALEEAEESRLVRRAGEEHAFDHALIHQAVYEDISPRRRRGLHLAAGEALERHPERVRELRAAEISRHFMEGGAPARALPYVLLAGDAAGAVFAHSEAERHYLGALGLAEEVGDEAARVRALEKLGAMLTTNGRYDESLEALVEAAADREGEARVMTRPGPVYRHEGGVADELIARLSALGEELDSPATSGISLRSVSSRGMAALYRAQAILLFLARRYEKALAAARRMLSLAREAGDDHTMVRAGMACGGVLTFLRRPEEAFEAFEAAVALAERAGATEHLLFGTLMLDVLNTSRGEFERGLWWARRGLALAEELDDRREAGLRLGRVGLILYYRGEWARAREYLERGAKTTASLNPSLYSVWAPGYLGMLDMNEGAFEEAGRRLEEAITLAEQVRWAVPVRYMRSHRAELDLLQGHPQAALARLKPLAGAADLDWNYSTLLLSVLARAHLDTGEAAKAEEVAERAIGEAESMHNRLDAVGALRAKGMAQDKQGRWDEAASTLEEALAMARSMPYPHAEACILHEYGVLHARKGDPEQAKEQLREALAAFEGLGAATDAQRTERELLALDPG